MSLREAAQIALDTLEADKDHVSYASGIYSTILALRAALAEQERYRDREVHMAHCNQGEYEGTCKYLEQNCPALTEPEYPLPDDLYPDSKDWQASNYAGRVEWLHNMYEAKKEEADRAWEMLAAPEQEPFAYVTKTGLELKRQHEDDVPLYTHPDPIPEGWKLVPVKPTEYQMYEGAAHTGCSGQDGLEVAARVYRTMISAAPEYKP